jgi:hypothetical protein
METRGTGLTPNRMPKEWEKRPLDLGHDDPGSPGPEVTSKPTSRSLAPLPGEVNTVIMQGGDFVAQQISSRPGMRQQGQTPPTNAGIGGTDNDVLAADGFGPEDTDHHTGKKTEGSTKGRGAF